MNQTSRDVDFEELEKALSPADRLSGTGGDGGTFYPLHRGPWRTRTKAVRSARRS